jgi:predicted nucleic acid-binding protein
LAVLPYSVLVEVTAAIRRRTGSEKLALQAKDELLTIDTVSFVVLDDQAARQAAEIAEKLAFEGWTLW